MVCCKNPKGFRLMGCMTGFFTLTIAVVIVISIVSAFQNNLDAWCIVTKFIYLVADLSVGSALGTLFFSYAGLVDYYRDR